MKTSKYLAIGLLTLLVTICSGQTKNDTKAKTDLTEEKLTKFIEDYLIKEYQTGSAKLPVRTAMINGEKEIYMDKEIGGNSYSIPVDNKKFIKGDLTSDSKQDIIVSIGHSFGASSHETIYFLFTNIGNGFSFVSTFDSFKLSLCKTDGDPGQFYPEEIKNGGLIGTSNCYTNKDAKCCPSKKFKTTFKYNTTTKEMTLISQIEKK